MIHGILSYIVLKDGNLDLPINLLLNLWLLESLKATTITSLCFLQYAYVRGEAEALRKATDYTISSLNLKC